MSGMFTGCRSLKQIDLKNFKTGNVTEMQVMFWDCSGLTSLNLSNFDTTSLTNMYAMFIGCNNLKNLDISSFNTSKVTEMSRIFESTPSNIRIKANQETINKIKENMVNLTNNNFEVVI